MCHFSKKEIALAALHILLFAAAAVLIATFLLIWRLWGYVSLEQIIFHFTVPLSGSFNSALVAGIWIASLGAAAATLGYAYFYFRVMRTRSRAPLWILIAAFAAAAVLAEYKSGATGFVLRQFQTTRLFDSVPPPHHVSFSFPGEKRNLLVIHMESLEETFARPEVMGANLIPELERVQRENVHFDGFRQVRGTSWTTAGETGSSLGLPLLLPIGHNDYGNYESFLPGALSIFEVLERSGYTLEFLFPNDCSFGGIENLIRTHSSRPIIKDLRWFSVNRPDVDQHRGNNWGLRDRYLYEQLRQELTLRAAAGAPFAFFVETIDTHGPDTFYFLDPDTHAPERFHDFRDVVRASSLMMNEFLEWVKRQDFARDLTIVILGDHLWMGDSLAGRELGEDRSVYNVFINPIPTVERPGPRLYCTPDFAPTILEAVGAKLPKRTFGIGRSLFSAQPTLMEQLGEEKFNDELGKTSKRYNLFFKRPRKKRAAKATSKAAEAVITTAPRISFRDKELFVQSALLGAVQFALINTTDATLLSSGPRALSILAQLCDGRGEVLPDSSFPILLPRDLAPQDAELLRVQLPLPQPGAYTLRLSFAGTGISRLPPFEIPLTIGEKWLFASEPFDGAGVSGTEQAVIEAGVPCLAFPERMEVYKYDKTLFFKMLDRGLTAAQIGVTSGGTVLAARPLRRAGENAFKWAAVPLPQDLDGRIDITLPGKDGAVTMPFSLAPTRRGTTLREERDLLRYVQRVRQSDYLLLAAANERDGGACLAALSGASVLTMQTSSVPPLHYETEFDNAFVELNAYATPKAAASPVYTRLSLRIDGVEYAASQHGLNFVVYDPRTHAVVDRASFECRSPISEVSDLLCDLSTAFDAQPATHVYASAAPPVERGAFIASWPNGPYVTRFDNRLYFQTPWEQAYDVTLIASPLAQPFAPLERAVSSSPAGVLSCVPLGDEAVCEVGYTGADGVSHTVSADMRPLYLETSFAAYLRRLNDPDYTVFISVLEEGARRLTATHKELFAALGLDMLLEGTRYHAYAAIVDGGAKVFEECRPRKIDHEQTAGGLDVRLISTGEDGGFRSSVMLDGVEYSAQSLGMNIVVYSKKSQRVIDSVCFNTYADLRAARKNPRFKRQ